MLPYQAFATQEKLRKDTDKARRDKLWPLNSGLLLERYTELYHILPKPRLIVYMNKLSFFNFLVRLAILVVHFSYRVDGVKCLSQLITHLV